MIEINYVHVLVLLVILQSSFSERRIKDGMEVTTDKRYAVYLLKAPDAPVQSHGWTCGGAIISQSFVVTAAACVDDIQRMYVVAGYRKFVKSSQIEEDECTNKMKKRIIFTCVPKGYNLDYHKTESWARVDIAVVKTDSPFDFTDKSFEKYCSYIPAPIKINYDLHLQMAGTDVLALGWGHAKKFEENLSSTSFNQDTLHYAPIRILDLKQCLKYYSMNREMWPIIKKYMICTLESGNLDDEGNLIQKGQLAAGCIKRTHGRTCLGDRYGKGTRSGTSRDERKQNKEGTLVKKEDEPGLEATTVLNNENITGGLRDEEEIRAIDTPGICQNDHGGPLVTWKGSHEVLIGVATLYKLDEESMCTGPYLFTSTSCTGAFLHCILSMENETETRRCDNPNKQGFELVKRKISWTDDHPGRPAVNGIIYGRPQVPIRAFGPSYS